MAWRDIGDWIIEQAKSLGLGRLVGIPDDLPQVPDVEDDPLPSPPRRAWQGGGGFTADDDNDFNYRPKAGYTTSRWSKDDPTVGQVKGMIAAKRKSGATDISFVITAVFCHDSEGNENTDGIETTLSYSISYPTVMKAMQGADTLSEFFNNILDGPPVNQCLMSEPSHVAVLDT